MSCNGCRVLRKGCSDTCILRSSLQWIESPEAQGHATVFVAKFFGRAGMISFINAVAESQRPALFQSLLYEACGRTVNPVFGAVGLLWSGNWATCQAAVETVLKGGSLKPTERPTLHKSHGDSPLKRPHSLTEPEMSPTTEVRRVRSSNLHEGRPEIRGDVQFGYANGNELACSPDSEPNWARSSEDIWGSSETPKQAQGPAPSTQLVVPVARRVKPPTRCGLASKPIAEDHRQAPSHEQDWGIHRAIELDLSLNSRPSEHGNGRTATERDAVGNENASAQCDAELASCVEAGRSSSPCSFSINSEGSVASVEAPDFSISGTHTFIASRFRREDYHLLHLL